MQRSAPVEPMSRSWSGALARIAPREHATVVRWSYVLVACAVMVLLGARGMHSETTVSLQGDMPRYLMNGVFVHDFVRDHPLTEPLHYTYRYYARYPALSLGHHPPLLALAQAPFVGIFGVSVWTGRLVILVFAVIAVAAWFMIVRRFYGDAIAFAAALLFATSPFIVEHARAVLSEVPALAMMLLAVATFLRFSETQRLRDALWFACAAGLSVYAKQHTLFIVPILMLYLVVKRGPRALLRREALAAAVLLLLMIAPLVPITWEFSRSNVAWVRSSGATARFGASNVLYYLTGLWKHLVTIPVLVLAGMTALAAAVRGERRVLLFLLWIIGFYLELTFTGARVTRYAIYWIPPFLGLAAAGVWYVNHRVARLVLGVALALAIAAQGWRANATVPTYADGYEAAARYVVGHPHGQTVLYSAKVDSGYFVFFVRKHGDSSRRVVLRADKLLATSSIGRIIADEISSADELYTLLRDLGVGYVVIEDTPYASPALELLRTELRGPAFAMRKRIPIETNHAELSGVDLVIYEYLDYQPAKDDATLRLRVPLMGGNVEATMGELIGNGTAAPAQ